MRKINGVMREDGRLRDYRLVDGYRLGDKKDREWIERACGKLKTRNIKADLVFDGDCYYFNGSPYPCVQMVSAHLVGLLRQLVITRRL